MRRSGLIILSKALRRVLRVAGGHGSALPGRIIERLDPKFLEHTLARLPQGVVVVTGTNGKTTTTHMLVRLLRAQGLKVLTNPSGSNLTRGIISTIVEHSTKTGVLPYDIAVLELDEAYAPLIAKQVPPKVLVALNVMRDQLDRYGELDTTAKLISSAAQYAECLVVNANDTLLMQKTANHAKRYTFGLSSHLVSSLSSEATLFAKGKPAEEQKMNAKIVDFKSTESTSLFQINLGDEQVKATLSLLGIHNAMNASAAMLTTKILQPAVAMKALAVELAHFSPAFGRGETVVLNSRDITVALVKNPSGFTQNLATFVKPQITTMLILINDDYADGRDVSWLWDVRIANLKDFKGKIYIGGYRRYDMALRLKYEGITYEVIDGEIPTVMQRVLDGSKGHLLLIPTYTAMLAARKWLSARLGGKHIW